jgi:Reverse transcriptase (RNA-dependent DNA polymerase)
LSYVPRDEWVLELFDVEVAFLNALLKHPVKTEWTKVVKELGFLSMEESDNACAELTRAMYGNIDSPLQWMKKFISIMKGEGTNHKKSATDPCIFYKLGGGKVVLILILYVDDTLFAGERKEAGKKAKVYATAGTPGKTLRKNVGAMIGLDAYRSIVGKIMYYATNLAPEICNTVLELAGHLSNPGQDHWKTLGKFVGYLTDQGTKSLCLRKPRVLQSISDCD